MAVFPEEGGHACFSGIVHKWSNYKQETTKEHFKVIRLANIFMVYTSRAVFSRQSNYRRCTMKVTQAVDFHLQYHRANSKKKYYQNM